MQADPAAEAEVAAAVKRSAEPLALPRALERRRLPLLAAASWAQRLRADPSALPAVEALLRLERDLGDVYFIPSQLERAWSDTWRGLPAETFERATLDVATLRFRAGRYDEARSLAAAVRRDSPHRARALYLQALGLLDVRAGAPDVPAAVALLDELVALPAEGQERFDVMRPLGLLAQGRVAYAERRFADAVRWYSLAEQQPFSRNDALLEGAFARYQNGDAAGALAALQRPELADGNWPEAAVLAGIIHLQTGHRERVEASLSGVELRPKEPPVTRRLECARRLVTQGERELAAVRAVQAWSAPVKQQLVQQLEAVLAAVRPARDKLEAIRARNADRTAEGFAMLAEIVRLEAAETPASAVTHLEKLLPGLEDGSPAKAELLFRHAELLREAGRAAEAPKQLELVLAGYPDYERRAEVLLRAGETAEQLGKRDAAISRYEQLISEFPSSPHSDEARRHLARLKST